MAYLTILESTRNGINHGRIIKNLVSFFFSMALTALVGPWPLLQFVLIFYTVGRTPLDE
jgi:hypothetical protein